GEAVGEATAGATGQGSGRLECGREVAERFGQAAGVALRQRRARRQEGDALPTAEDVDRDGADDALPAVVARGDDRLARPLRDQGLDLFRLIGVVEDQ